MTVLYPKFKPGDMVAHVTDPEFQGVVVAFMVRGNNHSYEVAWDRDKSVWNLELELLPAKAPAKSIGFWSPDGKPMPAEDSATTQPGQ